MACTKNPKKFLSLIPYNGPHDYSYTVEYWGHEKFQMTGRCQACGSSFHDWAIPFDTMVERGFDPEFIRFKRFDRMASNQEDWLIEQALKSLSCSICGDLGGTCEHLRPVGGKNHFVTGLTIIQPADMKAKP